MRANNFLLTKETPASVESLEVLKTKVKIDKSFCDIQLFSTLTFGTYTADNKRINVHVCLIQGIICINMVIEATKPITIQMHAETQQEALDAIKRIQKAKVVQSESTLIREFLSLDTIDFI